MPTACDDLRIITGVNMANNVLTGNICKPTPVAARSKAWVCGRLLDGTVVRIPPRVSDVYCQVKVSAMDRSLVQNSAICLSAISKLQQ
jgi:hypothetical protein